MIITSEIIDRAIKTTSGIDTKLEKEEPILMNYIITKVDRMISKIISVVKSNKIETIQDKINEEALELAYIIYTIMVVSQDTIINTKNKQLNTLIKTEYDTIDIAANRLDETLQPSFDAIITDFIDKHKHGKKDDKKDDK